MKKAASHKRQYRATDPHKSTQQESLFVDWQLTTRVHLYDAAPQFQERSKQETRPASPEGKE